MTEQEWLGSTDPQAMWSFVRDATTSHRTRWVGWMLARRFQFSDRKWRLILLGCLLSATRGLSLPGLDSGRARVGGLADRMEVDQLVGVVQGFLAEFGRHVPGWNAERLGLPGIVGMMLPDSGNIFKLMAQFRSEVLSLPLPATARASVRTLEVAAERARQAELIRDILGNPFRGERIDPAWLAANDGAVLRLAHDIDAGQFDELPVLADALEDAGCANEVILSHCRGGGPHARGCWLLDLLTERE